MIWDGSLTGMEMTFEGTAGVLSLLWLPPILKGVARDLGIHRGTWGLRKKHTQPERLWGEQETAG